MSSNPAGDSSTMEGLTKWQRMYNIASVVSNMVNAIIGVGIITLPKTFAKSSIVFGVIMCLICCILIAYTSDLMVKIALKVKKKDGTVLESYGDLCLKILGAWAFWFLCFITFMMMFLCICTYNVVLRGYIKDIISDFMKETFIYDKYALIAVNLFVIVPLCLPRNLSFLAPFSFTSTIFVLVIVSIVIAKSPTYHAHLSQMTQERMVENEKVLAKERALWVCSVVLVRGTFYPTTSRHFTLSHGEYKDDPSRFNKLLDCSALKDECVNLNPSINGILETIRTCDDQIYDVVQEAHANYLYSKYSLNDDPRPARPAIGYVAVLGVFASTYITQQATLGLFRELKVKTLREWRVVQVLGFSIVYILCMALAISGYLAQQYQLGDTVFDKMNLRFYDNSGRIDYAVNIARILLVITILLTYPLQHYFARENVFLMFFPLYKKLRPSSAEFYNDMHNVIRPQKRFYYPITFIILTISLLIGLYLDGIITMYSISGSLFASPMIYILIVLALIWLNMAGRSLMDYLRELKKKGILRLLRNFIIPVIVLVFGIITLVLSFTFAILDEVNKQA